MNTLDRPRLALATAIAALAGYVDAVGFLSADRYFVSFMSGNTTRLATDVVREGASAFVPALLIAGFVLGVALGSIAAHMAGRWRKPAVLGLVTALLAVGAALNLSGQAAPMLGALVLAMGAINNTLQRDETSIALTYMTGALVRIGQELAGLVTGRRTPGLAAFVKLWLALTSGAALGAAAHFGLGSASLLVAAAFAAVLTLTGYRIARRLN